MRSLRCDPADYDNLTGQCLAPAWVEDAGILPPMTTADAWAIGGQIAALWAVAYVIRAIRKSLEVRIGI